MSRWELEELVAVIEDALCEEYGTFLSDGSTPSGVARAIAPFVAERLAAKFIDFDPCWGGDEQFDRHATVCIPFYEARAAALMQGGDVDA